MPKLIPFEATDGKQIMLYVWDNLTMPKGIVQISHGMAEHALRYGHFASFLNSHGFVVVANDHRGHGKTDPQTLGFCEGDIARDSVCDLRKITEYLREKYALDVLILGHSYGSFLVQEYLQQGCDQIVGAVLSGSTLLAGASIGFGRLMASLGDRRAPGTMFANMTFVTYDKKQPEWKHAWLSRNQEVATNYQNDPLCGFVCSKAFYHSLFSLAKNLYKGGRGLSRSLKLLLVGGSRDPVSNYGAGLYKLAKFYKKHLDEVQLEVFEGARHEVLNETNQAEVYQKILEFIQKCF